MFLNYINNFRGLAILFIVAAHSYDFFGWNNNEFFYRILNSMFADATIFFVFISGFLFQYLSGKYNYKDFLVKKFKKIILPYLLISIPAIIFFLYAKSDNPEYFNFFQMPFPLQIGSLYASGDMLSPLWYMPMVTIFFLISPVLIYIDKHPQIYKYLIPVSIIVSLMFPRTSGNPIFTTFLHLFSVYLIGMFSSRHREKIIEYSTKYFFVILSFAIAFFVLNIIFFNNIGNITNAGYFKYLNKIAGCFVFLAILYKCDNLLGKKLNTLAQYSFGIYFIHGYFMLMLDIIKFQILSKPFPGNFIYVLINFSLMTGLSLVIAIIIKRILGKKSVSLIGC